MNDTDPEPRPIMDTEQVVAAAQAAGGASVNILNLIAAEQVHAQGELEDIAGDLAGALHAVLSWMPVIEGDDNQLLGALERWLP